QLLFLDNLGHSNVFWTPLVARVLLFLIGLLITGGLVAVNIPFWMAAASTVDRRGGTVALVAGIAIAVIAGIGGGIFLAAQWQDVLLWMHGHNFGITEPVFDRDLSFWVFSLPVIDDLNALGWTAAVISLLRAVAVAGVCVFVEPAPAELPLPLRPPPGR